MDRLQGLAERADAALRRELRYAAYVGALIGFLLAHLIPW